MKKRISFLWLIVLVLLSVGCKKTAPVDTVSPVVDSTNPVVETPITDNMATEEALEAKDLDADYNAIKETGLTASAITLYLKENKEELNSVLGTEIITDYIFVQREALETQTEVFFSDSYMGIHQAISTAIESHSSDFENNSLIGAHKVKILDYIDNEEYKKVIEQCFDDGLGLVSGEGSYYPVVDFYAINSEYGHMVNEDLKAFLDITSVDVKSPLTVEEYLAVTPKELGERVLSYERFLAKYPDALYRDEVRNSLMVAIWKLVNPNPFDGMLNEDFTLSPELDMLYQDLLKADDAPVVQASVRGILEFAANTNGVLGSLDNSDALMEKSYLLHEAASNQIFELYKIEGFQ